MHIKTRDFKTYKQNEYSYTYWNKNTKKLSKIIKSKKYNLEKLIIDELDNYKKLINIKIPKGTIHADLFPDNILFKRQKIIGILDYYYSCTDHLIIDLAIIIVSWCFYKNSKNKLEINKFKVTSLLKGYNSIRDLSNKEVETLPLYCRLYCIRFILSRMIDQQKNHDPKKVVTKKPEEYIEKFFYFKKLIKFYFIV